MRLLRIINSNDAMTKNNVNEWGCIGTFSDSLRFVEKRGNGTEAFQQVARME